MRTVTLLLCLPLAACGATRPPESPVDFEFGRLEEVARGAFDRQELPYAELAFERLLSEARRTDDAGKIGNAAYNLAAVRYALGKGESTRGLLLEARHELARANRDTSEVDVLRARTELAADRPDEALAACAQAVADPDAPPVVRQEAHVLAGLAWLRRADLPAAEAELEAAREDGADTPGALRLAARLHEARGEDEAAARAFDREATARQERSEYGLMAEALALAGRSWLRAGRTLDGADRLHRAARTEHARQRAEVALPLAREAIAALMAQVEGLGEQGLDLARRLEQLVLELDAQLAPTPPAGE
ncbi:MAG: hypothetical protein H6825_16840 [Planctomycetes bacterium]|nr:hypothetical protein [Planctomycetota bacterium]